MKTRAIIISFALPCLLTLGALGAVAAKAEQKCKINVVILDDASAGLTAAAGTRRNDWEVWQRRLPTFLENLKMAGPFCRASGDEADASASIYAVELPPGLAPERRQTGVAEELKRIFEKSKRPSLVIARSSTGTDQLRIVLQYGRDFCAINAAKFLLALGEISPALAYRRIAQDFGPFTAPPTLVFDPRPDVLDGSLAGEQRARKRWGVLEETGLLPHYVLHQVAYFQTEWDERFSEPQTAETGTLSFAFKPREHLTGGFSISHTKTFSIRTRTIASIGIRNVWHGGVSFEAGNKYFIDETGTVKKLGTLALEAATTGKPKFTDQGQERDVAAVPAGKKLETTRVRWDPRRDLISPQEKPGTCGSDRKDLALLPDRAPDGATWKLAHGVTIEFDPAGGVRRVLGASGQEIKVTAEAPETARLPAQQESAVYEYLGKWLTKISISKGDAQPAEWRFALNGRARAFVDGEKGVFWTRSAEDGRIIQMAVGTVKRSKQGDDEFTPTDVFGAVLAPK